MRHYLVGYTCHCGEYEFSGQTVRILIKPKDKIEDEVHDYFKDFYSIGNLEKGAKKCESYEYNMGEVAVNRIRWEQITPAQRKVLKDLHIA